MVSKIYGFSLLRNGVKYDYSFTESLSSLSPLCESIHIALGDSDDTTEEVVRQLSGLKIISTTWDPKLRKGGMILSQQTNVALQSLRESLGSAPQDESAWGIYLQADEVLHEQDYEKIQVDIAQAEATGCDAVRFRYFHFWQSHGQIAINQKWYPQEIRAVRLRSEIESWGDAQSFRNFKKVYESDACVYHYGHVREEESYEAKKAGFFRMYSDDKGLGKYVKKMEKKDARTETLSFCGSHPELMRERIERLGERFEVPYQKVIGIVGDESDYDPAFISSIRAHQICWDKSSSKLKRLGCRVIVETEPDFLEKLLQTPVPEKMRSPLARTWPRETRLMLQLSEKNIGVDSRV